MVRRTPRTKTMPCACACARPSVSPGTRRVQPVARLLPDDDRIAGMHLFPGDSAQHQSHRVTLPCHVGWFSERLDADDCGFADHGRAVRADDDRGITAPARPGRHLPDDDHAPARDGEHVRNRQQELPGRYRHRPGRPGLFFFVVLTGPLLVDGYPAYSTAIVLGWGIAVAMACLFHLYRNVAVGAAGVAVWIAFVAFAVPAWSSYCNNHTDSRADNTGQSTEVQAADGEGAMRITG